MQISESFTERLNILFQGRYRLRWSDAKQNFQLEQRIGAGFIPGTVKIRPKNKQQYRARFDDMLRAQDGYNLVFVVTPGDRMGCVKCGSTIHVPAKQFAHVKCTVCALQGRSTYIAAGYWPLNDDLLQHLQKIDAYTGGIERVEAETNREMAQREKSLEREQYNRNYAALGERINRIVGIQQTGHTGKEDAWVDAPPTRYTNEPVTETVSS